MKKLFLTLILLSGSCIYPQIDTTLWYPLEVGNYWEYAGMNGDLHFDHLVIGDTVLGDGLKYFVILKTDYTALDYDSQSKFFRRVENESKVYTHNYLLFDFTLNKNELWQVYPWDSLSYRRINDEGEAF
jgi:hypothetical protein